MTCLIIKNDGVGDLILASGLVRSVAEHFGGDVDLVTCAENQEIAEGIVPLRKRLYVSRDGLRFSSRAASFGWLIARVPDEDKEVLREIRAQRYDVAIVLRRFIRQSTLVIMRDVHASQKHCAWQLPTNASPSMARRASMGWEHYVGYADVLSELSYGKAFVESVLRVPIDARPRLDFCTVQSAIPQSRKIALGIGGQSTNWHGGNWIELAKLLAEAGWHLLLIGGDNVNELAGQIVRKVPAVENQVGNLSMAATAVLLRTCDAYIGNDTGLSHLASLVVHKCLVILGGGTFRRFFPWPESTNQRIIYHGLDCFDCDWHCKFEERYCLSLIRPRDVHLCFERMMSAEASAWEVDLNPKDEQYQLNWRRSPTQRRVSVRSTTRAEEKHGGVLV